MSYPRRTVPMYHYVFASDEGFRMSFEVDGVLYSVEPIQMLNGSWAIPVGVFGILNRPAELSEKVQLATEILQLNCCDFKNCEHE